MPLRYGSQHDCEVGLTVTETEYDVAVVGGGIAGMSTAARLQADGLSTVVLEKHNQIGGCAGYYRRDGYAFDVGATTLVDVGPGGVGGQLLDEIGMEPPPMDVQDAYDLWLPDERVRLHRDPERWDRERREVFGDDADHRAFYDFLDRIADVFWEATRRDVKLPIQRPRDALRNVRAVGVRNLPLLRYLRWTMLDAMEHFDVADDERLRATMAMLVEDTVHAPLDEAPLINAVLGSSIRRPGIARAEGGMYGFWTAFADHYEDLGGTIERRHTVTEVTGERGDFTVTTNKGEYRAEQIVSTVPIDVTREVAADVVGDRLDDHVAKLRGHEGGAVVVFLGVPEAEVDDREVTHHQILDDYDEPLGDGNNMFVSVSAPGDDVSAPPGHRAVMLSTHCDLEPWEGLDEEEYERQKEEMGERLLSLARGVYPDLGTDPDVYEVGTPVTYERFTGRPRGAIGGYRQTMDNSNQNAVPQDVGLEGFYVAGDTTWPGLGTVACVKGSQIAAEHVLAER